MKIQINTDLHENTFVIPFSVIPVEIVKLRGPLGQRVLECRIEPHTAGTAAISGRRGYTGKCLDYC